MDDDTAAPLLIIDFGATVPPYEQLKTQLVTQIDDGSLTPGSKLPTVRGLATDLGLATNTVARAYRELETDGYVSTQGRRGTIVAGAAPAGQAAVQAAANFAAQMRRLGLSTADSLRLARTALDDSLDVGSGPRPDPAR